MKSNDANRSHSGVSLQDELARLCLPGADRDPERPLAWVNSVCLVFLLIGLCGARRGYVDIRAVAPLDEPVPVVVEPVVIPPTDSQPQKTERPNPAAEAMPVAVVIPSLPNIQFSVPTLGGLVVPAALATAPPVEPVSVTPRSLSVADTGAGGDRPSPPYPPIAKAQGEEGSVTVTLQADAAGNVLSVHLKTSSGYPLLDRATLDFTRRHWRLPTGTGGRTFQTTIIYRLQLN